MRVLAGESLLVAVLQLAPAPAQDVVVLQDGGRLEGHVIELTESYVEMQLGEGTVVGMDRTRVASVSRGGPRGAVAPAPEATPLEARDDWFVVHDADGRAVGKLHATVASTERGRVRLTEEWEFPGDVETTAITCVEVVEADMSPVSCFYHERVVREVDGRTVDERLVRGVLEDERFVVDTKTLSGGDRRQYPVAQGLRFPLALVEEQRRRPGGTAADEVFTVFDARREQFVRRRFDVARPRRVEWGDEVTRVQELSYGGDHRRNVEWLDAAARPIRREVNGPSLVAVAAPRDAVSRLLSTDDAVFPRAIALERDRRFALWLPNPSWRLGDSAGAGAVTASAPLHDASVALVSFRQIDEDVALASAADTVLRWLGIARPSFSLEQREAAAVRDRQGIRLCGTYEPQRVGLPRVLRCEVYVFSVRGRYMALCFSAPRREFEVLRPDFERMLASVELHPDGLRVGDDWPTREPGTTESR